MWRLGTIRIVTSEISHPSAAAMSPPTATVSFVPPTVALGNQGIMRVVVTNPNATGISNVNYSIAVPAGPVRQRCREVLAELMALGDFLS